MSLLDDARRLDCDWIPITQDQRGHMVCTVCEQPIIADSANRALGHTSDCAWLAMPRIVAALEAAERLQNRDPSTIDEQSSEWQTFVAALRGEVVPPNLMDATA